MLFTTTLVVIFHILKLAPIVFLEKWKKPNPEKSFFTKIIHFIINCLKMIFGILFNGEILYYVLYGMFTVFGVYIHPFAFIFHTTEVFLRYILLEYKL
jgi:hypothetical protein